MSLLRPDTLKEISHKTIILDTNALVEGYSSPIEFAVLLGELADAGCGLTTIGAVRVEFISKNRGKQELAKKLDFYREALTYPEIPNRTFEAQLNESSLQYAFGIQAQSFKAVDFMITAVLKKYSSSCLLLTNDHHDFTTGLFDLKMIIPLMPERGCVVSFGLYEFSEEKYAYLLK